MYKLKTLLITVITLVLIIIRPDETCAATYYVDATGGSDSNLGTTTGSAWQTISKVNSSSFSAGDVISFKKGEIWREQLTVPSSGAEGNVITINSYGTGNAPKIYGSSLLNTWSNSNISAESANSLNESFEATGYDNEGWVETIGSGSEVDEDSTDVSAPSDGGSQVLKILKVSPNFNAKTRYDLTTELPITYTRVYSNWTANGLSNATSLRIMSGFDNSGSLAWNITLNKTAGGTIGYQFYYFTNGGYSNTSVQTSYGLSSTWYKHEVKYDATNMLYEWKINGSSIVSGSLTGTIKTGIRYIDLGDAVSNYTVTLYLDRFALDTTKFLEDSLVLPDNIYYADSTSAVSGVWFLETNGTVSWGDGPKTYTSNFSNLVNEHDWLYYGGRVFIYSPSSPSSRYLGVEAGQRDYSIYAGGKSFLTIQGIETAYSKLANIYTLNGSDITISGNISHHVGDYFAGSVGRGIWTSGTNNSVIASNIVYQSSLSGIWTYSNTENVNNITIECNESYDNGHSNIDVLCSKDSAMTVSNVTIRYNKAYFTSSYSNLGTSSNNYYVSGQNQCTVSSVNIYYNIGYNTAGAQLQLNYKVNGANIYNNSFYGSLPSMNAWVEGISIDSVANGTSNVTIKNNIVQDVFSGVGGGDRAFSFADINSFIAVDYNNWYQSAGGTSIYAGIPGGVAYHFDDFAAYKLATGFDTHGFWQDPLYISTTTPDLHVQKTSPLVDTGVDLSLVLDYDGTSVPQGLTPDIGAYEYIPLTVSIEQKNDQSGLTNGSPVNFTVIFSETVTDFATGDVTISGTSGATTATVTGSGSTYNVAVSGMANSGTVIASILAGKATGTTGNTNSASTSVDNTVTYDIDSPTGGSISYTDEVYTTASVSLTVADGTDVNGVNSTTRVIERKSATLVNSVCGVYSDFSQLVATGTYPNYTDSTVTSGNCYMYRYSISDNASNQSIYVSTNVAKIDIDDVATPEPPVVETHTTETTLSPATNSSCTEIAPVGKPELFEIKVNKKNAILYITPPVGVYDSFYIAYSRNLNFWEYGTEFAQGYSNGVIIKSIDFLKSNTTYYFKVRAGRNCASGEWSNILKVKTTNSTVFKSYYKNIVYRIFYSNTVSKPAIISPLVSDSPKPLDLSAIQTPKPVIYNPPSREIPQVDNTKKKFCIFKWCFSI